MSRPDNQHINIYITVGKKDICISYNQDGKLEYVTDLANDKKMMVEIYTEGVGYEIKKETGYVTMDVCDVRCVRIMDLDYFVPMRLFIKNKK